MHVARIGFAPLKGCRHLSHPSVHLEPEGPVGDRVFCLVDPSVDRCLRTVENPALLQAAAAWDGGVLTVRLPGAVATGEPEPTGEVRQVDYWGRVVRTEVLAGPWAAVLSRHLARDVLVAACAPGEVVYGRPVTLVTRASLARLTSRVGAPVAGARFRATFEVGDTLPDEDGWIGRRLRLGSAEVLVRGRVPRCAVVDLDPASGARDLDLLGALARDGPTGGPTFGIEADVVRPGTVTEGDEVELEPARPC